MTTSTEIPDLSKFTFPQLYELQIAIMERLEKDFGMDGNIPDIKLGDRVFFQPPDHKQAIYGHIIRLNKKTVTIAADDEKIWRVSPFFVEQAKKKSKHANVISLKNRKSKT